MALRDLSTQFLDIWQKLSTLQKVSIGAASVAVVAAVTVLLLWANKPVYSPLYENLTQEDIQAMSDELSNSAISYRVSGNTIQVPKDNVSAIKMQLAELGLPATPPEKGFEIFDESKLGETELAQQVKIQRALQGELANSIKSMDKVVEAKVHLSIPKERLFVSEEQQAKASVAVKILPGQTLEEEEVRAISHLVSAAVKGLLPENIQVVDTAGNLLSAFMTEANEPYRLTNKQIAYERDDELYKEKKIKESLSKIYEPDSFSVKVNVSMNFNAREIISEKYGDTPVTRSQRSLEINSKQTGKGPQGIPGVESNLAEPDILVDGIVSEYSKTDETQNFEIDKTITRENKVGGEISRVTVSVIIDDKIVQELVNDKIELTRKPRTEEELNNIRKVVGQIVGVDANRGDVIEVANISFDTSQDLFDLQSAQDAKRMEFIRQGLSYISAVIILFMFWLLILRPILKRIDKSREIDEEMLGESALDAQMAGLEFNVGDESGFPKSVEELEREIEAELEESTPIDVEAVKSKVMLKKIEEQANEDPEMIANLVKAMIKSKDAGQGTGGN